MKNKLVFGLAFFLSVSLPAFAGGGVLLINDLIEEASGIVYHNGRNSLYVVEDEGSVFELTTNGEIIQSKYLGDYDLEGVAIGYSKSEIVLAIEGEDSLLFVDADNLEIKRKVLISRYWNDVEILKNDTSAGIEGIHNLSGEIFLVNQSYNLDPEKNPEDPSMIFRIKEYGGDAYIHSVVYFPYPDIAGMTEKNGLLYLISDDEDLILVYDPHTVEVIEIIDNPVEGDQEGITFDRQGVMYIAIDGLGVFKTKLER